MAARVVIQVGSVAVMALALVVRPAAAGANLPVTRVSSDPFGNPTSQHATELEPDTFANAATVVAAFQVGRFFDGGATDIGFVRSGDGGRTWGTSGFLPGMTFSADAANSRFERVSDPSVAYDAAHGTWLISSIPLTSSATVPTVFVNRSIDDGRTWSTPISLPAPASKKIDLDKNWTVCDNGAASPFRGTCYTEFDNFADGGTMLMSTSHDGGVTWSPPLQTAGHDKGLGGQPVVQPDGSVVVPFASFNNKIEAFATHDGGASWTEGRRGREPAVPRRGRRPAHQPVAQRRGGRGRAGVRRLGGLPIPRQVCVQRHRLRDVEERRELDQAGARPDRPGHQRRGPFHPRAGRRSDDIACSRALGADLLLLPGRDLR